MIIQYRGQVLKGWEILMFLPTLWQSDILNQYRSNWCLPPSLPPPLVCLLMLKIIYLLTRHATKKLSNFSGILKIFVSPEWIDWLSSSHSGRHHSTITQWCLTRIPGPGLWLKPVHQVWVILRCEVCFILTGREIVNWSQVRPRQRSLVVLILLTA